MTKKNRFLRKGVINMYFINIYDKTTQKSWWENFDSYYLFEKRCTKLKFSKKLVVVSRSNYEVE
jgi:hypothetical protein